jgi:hypothetical protein
MSRNIAFASITLTLSLVTVLVAGEMVCRVFFPDVQLRYTHDPEALYFFEPNQRGIQILSNGLPSPPATINELGLRGPQLLQVGRKILVLGDSFTFGAGVADDETFASRLDAMLGEEVSVVNGGQPGYGLFQMEATLRRLVEVVKPQIVIVTIWQGDLLRRPPSQSERATLFRNQKISRVLKTSVFLTHIIRMIEKAIVILGGEGVVPRAGEGGRGTTGADSYLRGLEADREVLRTMNELAMKYGKGLAIVFWPKEDFADHIPDAEIGLAEQLTERLEKFSRETQIPFVSVQKNMRTKGRSRQLLIPGDGHPTPVAHCIAAMTIHELIGPLGYPLAQEVRC